MSFFPRSLSLGILFEVRLVNEDWNGRKTEEIYGSDPKIRARHEGRSDHSNVKNLLEPGVALARIVV